MVSVGPIWGSKNKYGAVNEARAKDLKLDLDDLESPSELPAFVPTKGFDKRAMTMNHKQSDRVMTNGFTDHTLKINKLQTGDEKASSLEDLNLKPTNK